jgi:N-acetylneuraminic acid mutarotase
MKSQKLFFRICIVVLLLPAVSMAVPATGAVPETGERSAKGVSSGDPIGWTSTFTDNLPSARYDHTAVWTGSEMIIWGGVGNGINIAGGARYDPVTTMWTPIPEPYNSTGRCSHSAVWTGSGGATSVGAMNGEMMIWGGIVDGMFVNSGERYNPATDTWIPITTTNAPSARYSQNAVWTGNGAINGEMLIWGGSDYYPVNTGARYNPATDTWTPITTTLAPIARSGESVIWTGSEMLVWGGSDNNYLSLNTGARYNPTTDTWTPITTTNAPAARFGHTAVWTGSEMVIWGGMDRNYHYFNSGARYNPITDTWMPITTTNAPEARSGHVTIWTGSGVTSGSATSGEMIVWGGRGGGSFLNTGGRYNPANDTWMPMTTTNAPSGRYINTAVWTGKGAINVGAINGEMIVWGEEDNVSEMNTGGRYDPATDSWMSLSTKNIAEERADHRALWTGSGATSAGAMNGEMIILGGWTNQRCVDTNGRYDPNRNLWKSMSKAVFLVICGDGSAVWAGSGVSNAGDTSGEVIVWGGWDGNDLFTSHPINKGARYNPILDTWMPITTTNAPEADSGHIAIWTGSGGANNGEMIVWGGWNETSDVNTGARYNPVTDTWIAITTTLAPSARTGATAIWTGSGANNGEMIVWGGFNGTTYLNTGARYNPVTDIWTPITTTNAPTARSSYVALWTGSGGILGGATNGGAMYGDMIIWGGANGAGSLNTGARYNPTTDSWTPITTTNAPVPSYGATAIWTGSEMIVWGGGGGNGSALSNSGARYNPITDRWTPITSINAPSERTGHSAVWTGRRMIIWGGWGGGSMLATGGIYNPYEWLYLPLMRVR